TSTDSSGTREFDAFGCCPSNFCKDPPFSQDCKKQIGSRWSKQNSWKTSSSYKIKRRIG
ncbi:hypothetical protein HN51_023130, partial [Arachis hypogaea]